MFNLEKEIKAWRRQLRASGIESAEILDELESHLRDQIEEHIQSGKSEEAAFKLALTQLGHFTPLGKEFSKLGATGPQRRRKYLLLFSLSASGLMLLGTTWIVLGFTSVGETLGVSAMFALAVCLAVLPFWYRKLPGLGGRDFSFAPGLEATLELAQAEARGLNHDFVGTEHLLLALLQSDHPGIERLMDRFGLDEARVRIEIEKIVGRGPQRMRSRPSPLTPRSERVLKLAKREGQQMRSAAIGSEHLFLGLLLEPDGVGGLVLRSLGVDCRQARLEILKGSGPDDSAGPAPVCA